MTEHPDAHSTTPGGEPVFRHREPVTEETPTRDGARRAGVIAHLRKHLGVETTSLSYRLRVGLELEVLVFHPTEQRPFTVLATVGMSDAPMAIPGQDDREDRAELIIGVPAGWPGLDPIDLDVLARDENRWPMDILDDTARIPHTYGSFLSIGHTIDFADQELVPQDSDWAGAVIGYPFGLPPEIMYADTVSGEVAVLAVLPLRAAEREYKLALARGGDALLERLNGAGVTVAVDPHRPAVTAGAPPYRLELLLEEAPDHLGEVLTSLTPNFAEALAERGEIDAVFPPLSEAEEAGLRSVRFALGAPSDAAGLREAASGDEELQARVDRHQALLTLLPEQPELGPTSFRIMMAMSRELAGNPLVSAVWIPHQHRLIGAENVPKVIKKEAVIAATVYEAQAPDGAAAARTAGLSALGGREIWFQDADLSPRGCAARVRAMLFDAVDPDEVILQAGDRSKYGTTWYELSDGTDPITGAPVLVMAESAKPQKTKRRLFGR